MGECKDLESEEAKGVMIDFHEMLDLEAREMVFVDLAASGFWGRHRRMTRTYHLTCEPEKSWISNSHGSGFDIPWI